MAKKVKTRSDIPNPNSVTNRDVIQRLNFLYQASVYLNNVDSSASASASSATPNASQPSGSASQHKKGKKRTMRLQDLSRNYIETMKTVGTRTTVRMDPSIKRTLCKGCNTVLIPGSTASVRTKKSSNHGHAMVYTCTTCNHSYRIPAAPIVPLGEDAAEVPPAAAETSTSTSSRENKRKGVAPRLPALFARDAGHVVFAGNEQLDSSASSWNDGVYIT